MALIILLVYIVIGAFIALKITGDVYIKYGASTSVIGIIVDLLVIGFIVFTWPLVLLLAIVDKLFKEII